MLPVPVMAGNELNQLLDPTNSQESLDPLVKPWKLYFPEDEYNNNDPKIPIIEILSQFFFNNQLKYLNLSEIERYHHLTIDFLSIRDEIPVDDFDEYLKSEPKTVIACLGLSVYRAIELCNLSLVQVPIPIRIINYSPLNSINRINSSDVDKFISFQGIIVRVGFIKSFITECDFVCSSCGENIHKVFHDGIYSPPITCSTSRCTKSSFIVDRTHALTCDFQLLHVRDLSKESDSTKTSQFTTKTIDVELTQDLCGSFLPGDQVTITGIVKPVKTTHKNKQIKLFILLIKANNIYKENYISFGNNCNEEQKQDIYRTILPPSLSQPKFSDIYKFLVNSICPSLYGHEMLKSGLCLALFGGVTKLLHSHEDQNLKTRSEIHILIVCEKTRSNKILQYISSLPLRGQYIQASNTISLAPNICKFSQDNTKEQAIDCGILRMADNSVCCIEDIEKLNNDQTSILIECMDNQNLSFSRGNIEFKVPTRCSIIATTVPTSNIFNRSLLLRHNLKLSPSLLNLFDLIYVLYDDPDDIRHEFLSEYVCKTSNSNIPPSNNTIQSSDIIKRTDDTISFSHLSSSSSSSALIDRKSLNSRLKILSSERSKLNFNPVSIDNLRIYLDYARKNISPKLNESVKRILLEFFLSSRKSSEGNFLVGPNHLETLIRLAEARAKIDLRDNINSSDAMDVIEIMKDTLNEMTDEVGKFTGMVTNSSVKLSKNKQITIFMKAAQRFCDQEGTNIITKRQLFQVAKNMGLSTDHFDVFLDNLNQQNLLLIQKGGYSIQYTE